MARYAHASDFVVVADCFTRLQAATLLGVDTRTVARWMDGKSKIPWAAYQLLHDRSKYGLGERDAAEHFERNAIVGERDALRNRVSALEAELVRVTKLVDWGCANDPFIAPTDPRSRTA